MLMKLGVARGRFRRFSMGPTPSWCCESDPASACGCCCLNSAKIFKTKCRCGERHAWISWLRRRSAAGAAVLALSGVVDSWSEALV